MYLVYIIIRKENLYKRVYGLKNSLTKKCIRSIRWMSLCHLKDIKSSEGSQTHQKVFRKLDQKGDLQKDDLHVEDLTLKACFAWLMDIFKRSNLTRQRSKKRADTLKSWWTQTASFTASFPLWWCTYLLRKKATYFSLQPKTSGYKKALGSRIKVLPARFWSQ